MANPIGKLPFLLVLQLTFSGVIVEEATTLTGVRHLMGEADFRSVTLRWECDRLQPAPHYGFRVNYCEVQAWGLDRCRLQTINATSTNEVLMAPTSPVRIFFAQVNGLRMATNYSFEVWPEVEGADQDLISMDLRSTLGKKITLETKEFSAKATLCLPQFSEVEVETGPYFGGRIAVEGTDEGASNETIDDPEERETPGRTGKQRRRERKGLCWVDGDPESPKTTYTLRIEHAAGDGCGGGSVAAINDTAISAFVMVQESPSILTHSARRFLVLCSYQPGTLTVRAGIQLPSSPQSSGSKAEKSTVEGHPSYDDNDDDKGEAEAINDIRGPRILRQSREKKYEGLIMARARTAEKLTTQDATKTSTSVQLVLMLLLTITGVVGFAILAAWHLVMTETSKWRHRFLGDRKVKEPVTDSESASEVISSGTLIDLEVALATDGQEEDCTPFQQQEEVVHCEQKSDEKAEEHAMETCHSDSST